MKQGRGTVPKVHLNLRECETVADNYLRAALAYMLISMPQGTSTIFGAFQAILALLTRGLVFHLRGQITARHKVRQ
jgi:hypothetical protein